MKIIKHSILFLFMVAVCAVQAQDVDEIINNYIENTGGMEAWSNLKGIKITAKVNQGGMEIPIEIVQMADGRQYFKVIFQGTEIMQGVFDGETVWSTNFQTMKAEKADAETTENAKLDANDFPEAFINYKDKGYTAELVGTETLDGAETLKVKLVKEPLKVDGEEVENITYYYFDAEAFVPLAQESEIKSGQAKGSVQMSKMSDYDEVEGLYFPFSLSQGIKGGPMQPIVVDKIEINPEVDDSVFAFPEG